MAETYVPSNVDRIRPFALFPGYGSALIMQAKQMGVNHHGETYTRFILKPSETFRRLNDIQNKELKSGMYYIYDCPNLWIIDPSAPGQESAVIIFARSIRGHITDFTKFFFCHNCGKKYHNVFESMRTMQSVIESDKIQKATLKRKLKEVSEKLEIDIPEDVKKDIREIKDNLRRERSNG